MLLADVPQALLDATAVLLFLSALSTVVVLLWRTPPFKWLRRNITRSFGEWVTHRVREANEPLQLMVDDTRHRVTYHLGSNDTTKPLHERMSRLEQRFGLEPVRQQPDPPLFGPHGEPRDEEGHDV